GVPAARAASIGRARRSRRTPRPAAGPGLPGHLGGRGAATDLMQCARGAGRLDVKQVRRLPTPFGRSYKPTLCFRSKPPRNSMVRLKFFVFALVALAVAAFQLYVVSPTVGGPAESLATEAARSAALAARGEVIRQKQSLVSF